MIRTLAAGTTVAGLLLLAPGVTAQEAMAVLPAQNANAEGATFAYTLQSNESERLQTIYDANEVSRHLAQWDTLLLRPDNSGRGGTPAYTRQLSIRISTRGVPSPELASRARFSDNYGTDLTEVLTNKSVSFPSYTVTGSGPAPFLVRIPLDRPFPFGGYFGHVLLEIDAQPTAGPQVLMNLDAERFSSQGWTVITNTFGSGCGGGGGGGQSYQAGSSSVLSTIWTSLSFNGGGPYVAVAWLGTSTTSWGGLPLPLSLALLGAPGCSLYTEPAVTFVGMTFNSGSSASYMLNLPTPRNFSLLGKHLYSQTMVFGDPRANNPARVRVSPAADFLFSTPPQALRSLSLFSIGSIDDTPDGARLNDALVLGAQ